MTNQQQTNFHTVTVKVKYEDDKGKIKTRTERFLVDAMSVTEAEGRAIAFLGTNTDYDIVSASQSRIVSVLSPTSTPEIYK